MPTARAETVVALLDSPNEHVKLPRAAVDILDRVLGKALERHEHAGPEQYDAAARWTSTLRRCSRPSTSASEEALCQRRALIEALGDQARRCRSKVDDWKLRRRDQKKKSRKLRPAGRR